MPYVMIQNKGELPLWGMRLMGLSLKKENSIGQFGTGLKESIALLTRLGLQPIIFSGELRMNFQVELMDGQEEICFKLSETKGRFEADVWHGLGIHPNLGKHDWDDPWMILREVICNALDESGIDDLFHDICYHEPIGVKGSTRFYIPATKSIIAAYNTIESKLLPLSKHTIKTEIKDVGKVLEKREDKRLQTFYHGVWIQSHQKNSLFDYELYNLKLNESRSADWFLINHEIGQLVSHYTEEQVYILLQAIIRDKQTDLYEAEVLNTASYSVSKNSAVWINAFFNLFGEKAILTDDNAFLYDKLKALGFVPIIVIHTGLTSLLKAAGIPTVDKVLTRNQRKWKSVSDPSNESVILFNYVWKILDQAGLQFGAIKPKLQIFTERPGAITVFGSYTDGIVSINQTIIGSQKERQAILEELAHHISEAGDETREFQTFLLELADYFMFERITI